MHEYEEYHTSDDVEDLEIMEDPYDMGKAVEKGAALLDAKLGPDWPAKVDTENLIMASHKACVVGQLMGDYRHGSYELGLVVFESRAAHGFTAHDDHVDYHALTATWRKLIESRTS